MLTIGHLSVRLLFIKAAITSAPCLGLPDYSKPFDVFTDAYGHGLLSFFKKAGLSLLKSRQMTPCEESYDITK